ncbi:MAG: HK97 gp10 family phage protein [Rhodospirillales bacterium]|jgi:phage gpG-like protein
MRVSITSTAGDLVRQYQRYAQRWDAAVAKGLRDIAISVEREAVKNTGGPSSAAPGEYPVPVRKGNLRRSIGSRFGANESMVIATAEYASAIHNGFTPYGNPNARKSYIGRPFLTDAVKAIDLQQVMAIRIDKELGP